MHRATLHVCVSAWTQVGGPACVGWDDARPDAGVRPADAAEAGYLGTVRCRSDGRILYYVQRVEGRRRCAGWPAGKRRRVAWQDNYT